MKKNYIIPMIFYKFKFVSYSIKYWYLFWNFEIPYIPYRIFSGRYVFSYTTDTRILQTCENCHNSGANTETLFPRQVEGNIGLNGWSYIHSIHTNTLVQTCNNVTPCHVLFVVECMLAFLQIFHACLYQYPFT